MRIETAKILLREPVLSDYESFAKWESDSKVIRFLSFDDDRTYDDVITEAKAIEGDSSKLDFTIVSKEEDRPIGRVYLSRIDRAFNSVDITKLYIGDENMRGKGLGREVINALLKYFFESMDMERVTLDYFTGNEVAMHLYESIGFTKEGVARNAGKKNDKYYDLNLMSILSGEYFAGIECENK